MAGEITVGGNILASHTGVEGAGSLTLGNTVAPASSYMFRNKIINGNFDIWQRGTSQTSTGWQSADRWRLNLISSGSTTLSQQAFDLGQTEVPGNPKYYARLEVTTDSSSSENINLRISIEDVNTLAGKTATLSFWAKADSDKDIVSEFYQVFGTDGSDAVAYIGNTTHNLTTSWKKFTATVLIPSISEKIVGSVNNYLGLYLYLSVGTDKDDRTNSLGNQSGTFDIAQVQLEEGPVATPFEHRPISVEETLCRRYFQYFPFGVDWDGNRWSAGAAPFPVIMRTTPTIVNVAYPYYRNNINTTVGVVGFSALELSNSYCGYQFYSETAGRAYTWGYVHLDAEL